MDEQAQILKNQARIMRELAAIKKILHDYDDAILTPEEEALFEEAHKDSAAGRLTDLNDLIREFELQDRDR